VSCYGDQKSCSMILSGLNLEQSPESVVDVIIIIIITNVFQVPKFANANSKTLREYRNQENSQQQLNNRAWKRVIKQRSFNTGVECAEGF
jgi:flagellar biosynthesis protein FliP